MSKIYLSDEDKMMRDRSLKWSTPSVMKPKPNAIDHVLATHWETYIIEAIKTGIESPTPYESSPIKMVKASKKLSLFKSI
jgi:hypothetical protein